MKNLDLIAKLMSTENITIERANVTTASFDIKTRVLTLPVYDGLTSEIEEMLICHEVGHALFTPISIVEEPLSNVEFHYLNVIEDVRCNRLMKRKFPGVKRIMFEGYRQLFETGKCGEISSDDLLIDRINIGCKCGEHLVQFNQKEYEFVVRAETIETALEAKLLAKEIYEYEVKKHEEEKNDTSFPEELDEACNEVPMPDDDTTNEDTNLDVETDTDDVSIPDVVKDKPLTPDEIDNADQVQGNTPGSDEDALMPKTTREIEKNLLSSIGKVTKRYIRLGTEFDPNTIIDHKRVLKAFKTHSEETSSRLSIWDSKKRKWIPRETSYNEFKLSMTKTVSYLVKEFELRKSAIAYKRVKVSKTGALNMNKLWSHKLQDDIFKSLTSVNNDKNHGMIFLVDWSGSIHNTLSDVLQQTIILASFCHKIQIPFQVFAFASSDCLKHAFPDDLHEMRVKNENFNTSNFNSLRRIHNVFDNTLKRMYLLELFSNKMTTSEFNNMSKELFDVDNCIRTFTLGGTPLNQALTYMLDYVGKFKTANNVEKMSFVTLTDGESDNLKPVNYVDDMVEKQLTTVYIDPVTKREYEFEETQQTDSLLQCIRDRHNTTNIGFYVLLKANPSTVCKCIFHNNLSSKSTSSIMNDMIADIRTDKMYKTSTRGRDQFYVVTSKHLQLEEKTLEIKTNATASAIATQLTRVMNANQVNKLLLNSFIEFVS